MESITIQKKNEVFMHVQCEPSIEKELSEHFCFFVPGYKFMPAYRNRMWDGKIRLYDMRKKTLYCGLHKYLQEFCTLRNYTLNEVESEKYSTVYQLDTHDINSFLSQLVLSVKGSDITPRNYQLDALSQCISHNKSLLLSPTASGKSLIIYLAVRYFLDHYDENVLIIVPTTSLVEQMYSDFADYSEKDNWNVDENCHRIYSGKEKFGLKQRVLISTWQSIYKLPGHWFIDFGMVIGDEAHNFKAKSLTSIMEKCTEARFRIGTTGTLDGSQTHQLVLEGLFGPVYKVTTTKELIDNNDLSQLDIKICLLKYSDEVCKIVSGLKYQDELDFIVKSEERNEFICNLAKETCKNGNTLILFQFVEKHGNNLHLMMTATHCKYILLLLSV